MELTITIVPADDPDSESEAFQAGIEEFAKSLEKAGFEYEAKPCKVLLTDWSQFTYARTFLVRIIKGHHDVPAGFLGAWIAGRCRRKVWLKVGDIEAEAQTVEEVEELLKRAEEIEERKQPKVIHEP